MREYLIRFTPGRGREATKRVQAAGYERRGAWFEFYGESSGGKREVLDSYRAFDVSWIEALPATADA
ncbi:MAG TPA: hypothetical protein VID47_09530 [Actinomycetota bacterium]|jgi:hypothetical protein